MEKNVGTLDAIARITCGLTGVAWGTSKMVKHPSRAMPIVVTLLCAMRAAEGFTRYCPMLDMLDVDTLNGEEIFTQNTQQASSSTPATTPENSGTANQS